MEAPLNNIRKRGIHEGAKGRSNFVDTDTDGFIEIKVSVLLGSPYFKSGLNLEKT